MDENGPKCMKERVLEHRDRSLVAPKDDDRSNNTLSFMHFGPFSSIIKPHGTRRARIARTSFRPSSLASTAQYDQTDLNKSQNTNQSLNPISTRPARRASAAAAELLCSIWLGLRW